MLTVVGARLGGPASGTAPGEAELWLTLRAYRDERLAQLQEAAALSLHGAAGDAGLTAGHDRVEPFPATLNTAAGAAVVRAAAQAAGLACRELPAPMRWSEDFGRILQRARNGALVGLGAGMDCPPLPAPDYDFPDVIAPAGTRLLPALVDEVCCF